MIKHSQITIGTPNTLAVTDVNTAILTPHTSQGQMRQTYWLDLYARATRPNAYSAKQLVHSAFFYQR